MNNLTIPPKNWVEVRLRPGHPPRAAQPSHNVRRYMSLLSSHFCALFVVPFGVSFLFLFCLLCPLSLQILLARAERWGGDFSLRRRKSSLCHIIFLLFNVISRKWFFYQIFFPFCYVSISWWVKRGFGKILWCVGRPHKICRLLNFS